MISTFPWFVAVVVVEAVARRTISSRAHAWMVAYGLLGLAALIAAPGAPQQTNAPWVAVIGAAVAVTGYPVGRKLLDDRADRPPPGPRGRELAALALVVAPVEELVWGAIVEPQAGIAVTAALFAVKHPLIDGRWRRTVGLASFWLGLGLIRTVSWPAALILHVVLNSGGVIAGHRRGLDQF